MDADTIRFIEIKRRAMEPVKRSDSSLLLADRNWLIRALETAQAETEEETWKANEIISELRAERDAAQAENILLTEMGADWRDVLQTAVTERDALQRENRVLRIERDRFAGQQYGRENRMRRAEAEVDRLTDQITDLTAALEWYAEPVFPYAVTQRAEPRSAVHQDGGQRARDALARLSPNEETI